MAGDHDIILVPQGLDQLGDRGCAGQREPVLLGRIAEFVDAVCQVGQREAHLLARGIVDAAGDGYGLEADAGAHVNGVEGELNDLRNLVVIKAADDGRDVDDLEAGLADVLDGLHLDIQKILPAADLLVQGRIHAVELKVEGVEPGFPGFFCEGRILGELEAVRGALHVGKTHLAGFFQNPEPVGVQRGLAAGELNDAAGDGTGIAKRLQHLHDLLVGWFVDVILDIRVGETDRAGKIAAIGQDPHWPARGG